MKRRVLKAEICVFVVRESDSLSLSRVFFIYFVCTLRVVGRDQRPSLFGRPRFETWNLPPNCAMQYKLKRLGGV